MRPGVASPRKDSGGAEEGVSQRGMGALAGAPVPGWHVPGRDRAASRHPLTDERDVAAGRAALEAAPKQKPLGQLF